MKARVLTFILIACMTPFWASAQDTIQKNHAVIKEDTIRKKKEKFVYPKPYHWNVIKYNPTTWLLWNSQNFTFSYERLINRHQSATISIGRLVFSPLVGDTVLNLLAITDRKKSGINFSVEYRFYLGKRNGRPAPDGVYIAPYYAFYGYQFTDKIDIMRTNIDSAGQIHGKYYAHNLGVQLGYQFIFWKRLSLDFLMFGPSIAYYGGETNITGNLSTEELRHLNEEFYDKLIAKFPAAKNLFVDHTFEHGGQLKFISMGLRYAIQIGFHF